MSPLATSQVDTLDVENQVGDQDLGILESWNLGAGHTVIPTTPGPSKLDGLF